MAISISPGHWLTGGAVDLLNEVTEARKITNRVVAILRGLGVTVNHIEDNTSKTQAQNLTYLLKQHNASKRELDISIHLNSSGRRKEGIGTEVLYYDAKALAAKMSAAIAEAGEFINRGAKQRQELAFLNGTHKPAILLEVLFVSSEQDAKLYRKNFEAICQAIAKVLAEHIGVKTKPTVNDKIGYNIAEDASVFRIQSGKLLTKEDAVQAAEKALQAGIISYATVLGTTK